MSISTAEPLGKSLAFDPDIMGVELADGHKRGLPPACFPRFLHAVRRHLESYAISGGGKGLHWDDLDEDSFVSGLLEGVGDRTGRR